MPINAALIAELIKEKDAIQEELDNMQKRESELKVQLSALFTIINGNKAQPAPIQNAPTYDFPYWSNSIWTHRCYAALIALETAFSSDIVDFIAMEENKEAKEIDGNVSQAMNKLKTEGYIKSIRKEGKKLVYAIVPEKYKDMEMERILS